MNNTNTFQQNKEVTMHGQGSPLSDITIHEDFVFINVYVTCYYEKFLWIYSTITNG
jgi:hypothetical protein